MVWKVLGTGSALIAGIVAKGEPVYGINTGFGKLASVRIPAGDVETLQRNLIELDEMLIHQFEGVCFEKSRTPINMLSFVISHSSRARLWPVNTFIPMLIQLWFEIVVKLTHFNLL